MAAGGAQLFRATPLSFTESRSLHGAAQKSRLDTTTGMSGFEARSTYTNRG
jgi:hypothetical protein